MLAQRRHVVETLVRNPGPVPEHQTCFPPYRAPPKATTSGAQLQTCVSAQGSKEYEMAGAAATQVEHRGSGLTAARRRANILVISGPFSFGVPLIATSCLASGTHRGDECAGVRLKGRKLGYCAK